MLYFYQITRTIGKVERNMKKTLITAGVAILLFIIFEQSGIFNALVGFVLVGAIPGTSYSIPSTLMLFFAISILWLILARLTTIERLLSIDVKQVKQIAIASKKHMLKRRFSRV